MGRQLCCLVEILGNIHTFSLDAKADHGIPLVPQIMPLLRLATSDPQLVDLTGYDLWKLSRPEPLEPEDTLLRRVLALESTGNLTQLNSACSLPDILSNSPSSDEQQTMIFFTTSIVRKDDLSSQPISPVEENLSTPTPPIVSIRGYTSGIFATRQNDPATRIYCDRPASACHPTPITLLHPIFAQFNSDLKEHEPTPDDCRLFSDLRMAMFGKFDDVHSRAQAFREVMAEHGVSLGMPCTEGMSWYATDKEIQIITSVGSFSSAWVPSGLDVQCRGAIYYTEQAREAIKRHGAVGWYSNFPSLIIHLLGGSIAFAGAVLADRPIVQMIGPTVRTLTDNYQSEKENKATAGCLGAFRKAALAIQHYYQHELPNLASLPPEVRPDPQFPYVRDFVSLEDGHTFFFRYTSQVPGKLIFFGITAASESQRPTPICIKFVRGGYSREAHEYCVQHNFAPALRGIKEVQGMQMIIMDLIDEGYTCMNPSDSEVASPQLYSDIRQKIDGFHAAGFVHGNINNDNIMVREGGQDSERCFMLLGFSRAGKQGPDKKYPYDVDVDLFSDKEECKPQGVKYNGEILASHDEDMLKRIFGSDKEEGSREVEETGGTEDPVLV